jgi:hypothetical protein
MFFGWIISVGGDIHIWSYAHQIKKKSSIYKWTSGEGLSGLSPLEISIALFQMKTIRNDIITIICFTII